MILSRRIRRLTLTILGIGAMILALAAHLGMSHGGASVAAAAAWPIGIMNRANGRHPSRTDITETRGDMSRSADERAIRAINRHVALADVGPGTAQPFLFPGDKPQDRLRAIDCLAAAAYYEAGNGAADQGAVMQVVLNRVRHRAFAHTICGVVFQQSDMATGCQFTFTCDGSLNRRRPSTVDWSIARRRATLALGGATDAAVGSATHYHTDYVFPDWSPHMDKVAVVNSHLFFRWRGDAGRPDAFSSAYTGGEPIIDKLAHLSTIHGLAVAPPPAISIPEADAKPAMLTEQMAVLPKRERLSGSLHAPEPDIFLIALDARTDPDMVLSQARRHCTGKSYCKVIGWTDPRFKADSLPISGAAIDAISFIYVRPDAASAGNARWNCREFERQDLAQCLRRGA